MQAKRKSPGQDGDPEAWAVLKANENGTRKISNIPGRKARAIGAWLKHARPGDFARAIFAPRCFEQAVYGRPLPLGVVVMIERVVGGGDVAILRGFDGDLVIMPKANFETLAGGRA